MATPKYQVQVTTTEVADPHVGLVLSVTENAAGQFDPGSYPSVINISIAGEGRPDPVNAPPTIQIPLPGNQTSRVFVLPFSDAQYGPGRAATVSMEVNGVNIPMPNGGRVTTGNVFQDPEFRFWMPAVSNNANPWQQKLPGTLNAGDYLMSANQRYKLVLEYMPGTGAYLAIFDLQGNPNSPIWQTPPADGGQGNYFAVMVEQGNLCIYEGSYQQPYPQGYGFLWGSYNSNPTKYSGWPAYPSFLMLGDDGLLHIYSGSDPDHIVQEMWNSGM